MPTLTIDNQTVTVPEGTTVLEAAEQLGIVVPHFCFHPALGAVGACRMCAVTIVEGTFKGLKMSCLVKAEEGMAVTTGDQRSTEFRARVGEWLMLNHPHDCPVCDEGGECQLQEMTIASGHGMRRYRGKKRTYNNQQLGPFIIQEMNRCIQCYRCVRTYQDYCGGRDFGVMGSRNRLFFGRFQDGTLESDFSGNIVDVCPTGVFTDNTFRFKTRYWDLQEAPSVCPHCSLGCSTIPGGRFREIQRVRSGINPKTNGYFICDRSRFGSGYVNHCARPRQARSDEQLVSVDDALRQLDVQARDLIARYGPEAVLLLGSERASLETNWLLQRWAKDLGCRAPLLTAHRPRHQAAQVAAFDLADRLATLDQVRRSDLVLVFGADPLAEAPLLALALRQVVRNGGRVLVYDPRPVELPAAFDHQAMTPLQLRELLGNPKFPDAIRMRELLVKAEHPVLVGGGDLLGAGGLLQVEKLAHEVSVRETPCLVFPLLNGPNSFGAALLSPSEQDDLITRLESGRIRMLVCVENDPLLEALDGERFATALANIDELVVFDYLSTPLVTHATLFLPTCPPPEAAGVYINNAGRMHSFAPVLEPGLPISVTGQNNHPPREFISETPGSDPRPAWQLLQALLASAADLATVRARMVEQYPRLFGLTDLQPEGSGIRVGSSDERSVLTADSAEQPAGTLQLIISQARYGGDLFSRFSSQLVPRLKPATLTLHPQDAADCGLREGSQAVLDCEFGSFKLPWQPNEQLAPGCALVEATPAFPQLVPGGELSFCSVGPEVRHD